MSPADSDGDSVAPFRIPRREVERPPLPSAWAMSRVGELLSSCGDPMTPHMARMIGFKLDEARAIGSREATEAFLRTMREREDAAR